MAVYDQLSEVLSKAHIALFRVPIDKECAKLYKRWFGVTTAERKFWKEKPFVDPQVRANMKLIHHEGVEGKDDYPSRHGPPEIYHGCLRLRRRRVHNLSIGGDCRFAARTWAATVATR
jgi:hypothetical protein